MLGASTSAYTFGGTQSSPQKSLPCSFDAEEAEDAVTSLSLLLSCPEIREALHYLRVEKCHQSVSPERVTSVCLLLLMLPSLGSGLPELPAPCSVRAFSRMGPFLRLSSSAIRVRGWLDGVWLPCL